MGYQQPIDTDMVDRICAKAALQLTSGCTREDAVYQLQCFRERYHRDKALAPKLAAAALRAEIKAIKGNIERLNARLTHRDHQDIQDAIAASSLDLCGNEEWGRIAMRAAVEALGKLSRLVDNLAEKQEQYQALFNKLARESKTSNGSEWKPDAAHALFTIKSRGHRAVVPYVSNTVAHQQRELALERSLAEQYIPDLYYFMFGKQFSAWRQKLNAKSTYTGPSIRFALALFEELGLHDGLSAPEARADLVAAIGSGYDNRNKKKYR